MSRFASARLKALDPYVPGEQPQDKKYVKLNTNEAFFRPCPAVFDAVGDIAERLRLYNDPEAKRLVKAIADNLGVEPENVLATNGSDEALAFAQKAEHGYRHSALIHSLNVDHMTRMARAMDTTVFIKNGPCMCGLGLGGEGYLSYSIATTTGEGISNPKTFTRRRRCVMVGNLSLL